MSEDVYNVYCGQMEDYYEAYMREQELKSKKKAEVVTE